MNFDSTPLEQYEVLRKLYIGFFERLRLALMRETGGNKCGKTFYYLFVGVTGAILNVPPHIWKYVVRNYVRRALILDLFEGRTWQKRFGDRAMQGRKEGRRKPPSRCRSSTLDGCKRRIAFNKNSQYRAKVLLELVLRYES